MLLATSNSPRFRFTLNSELLGPLVLSTDPVGWDRIGVSLHRDTLRHGLTTEYSAELGFVKQGRAYLMRAYDAAGIEADVRLRVEQLDPNEFAWLPYYSGRVNLTTRQLTDIEFRANVENENFIQKFLNRESVAVDLLGDTNVSGRVVRTVSPITVEMHSRALVKRFNGEVRGAGLVLRGLLIGAKPLEDELSQTFYFGYSQDSSYLNEIGLQQIAGGLVSGDAPKAVPIYKAPDHGEYLVEFGGAVQVRIRKPDGVPVQQAGLFSKVDIKFQYRLNADPTSPLYELAHVDHAVALGLNYSHTFVIPPQSFTHQLVEGDRIYLYAEIYTHDITTSGGRYQFEITVTEQPGTYLRIRATTKTKPTPCTGLLAYEVLDRLASALTDESDALRSTYFGRPDCRVPQPSDGPGALLLLTGGFQLRGFPLPSAPTPLADAVDTRKSIYATWRDLWDSLSAIYGLGYGLELNLAGNPVIRVEPLSYFYPATVVLDLTVGRPDHPAPRMAITTKELASRYFQNLEFGYDAWRAEQVNGLDEANTKRQWTSPLTQVSTTYSQVSKYATSGQLLEVTRRQRYEESATTDNGRDNANFFVALLRRPPSAVITGFETERDQRFSRLEGMLDPTSIYNARLTPARNLRRHGAVLRAGLEPAGDRLVRFAFGEGNNEMVSQLVGEAVPVAEKADIRVSELASPLWRPVVDSFKAPISRQQLQTLLANPLGRVRYFDAGRKVREGWILDFTHESDQGLGSFELLPCAD